ncbi:hypothetical protein AcW1_000832 [Taiwanofungus camphoratus]|nr:hypothetical protein AcV7_000851 [Antrodia cinnamomea]KAI0963875.1 hypothetical protein AcW1_000832 [Antrodia cinnamomea]
MHERMPQTDDLSSIVQVLVRNALTPLHTQVSTLRSQPPHILIGTPQALTDALKEDESILQLDNLSTVVVDEADYLLPYIPRTADKHAKLKAERMMRKHPDPTRLILDKIFTPSRLPSDNKQRVKILEQIGTQSGGIHRPQLILSSATFRVHFRNWLMRESGWLTMDKNKLVKIKGDLQTRENALNEAENEGGSVLRTDNIQYYALIVSAEGKIINIEGATEPATTNEVLIGNVEDITDTVQSTSTPASDALIMESQVVKPLPFNSTTLEAISEIFALDVPRLALLVLPASAPLRQVVAELCDYGVNAHSLDVFQKETGGAYLNQGSPDLAVDDPTLLVSTLASIRGLDLPELTHVFILGVPEDRPVDSYLHAAGRVGRFGRNGKVISVLEARQEIEKEGGKKVWKDEPGKMQKMFAKTGIRPTKMDHFA